jgi:hypothetical protein
MAGLITGLIAGYVGGLLAVLIAGLIGMALEPRDTPDQAFRYRSLGTRSGTSVVVKVTDEADIRLLELLPSKASGARIRCRLHHYLLFPTESKWKKDFNALSYTWGDESQERLIIIDGKGFLVTENLQLALWRLRLRSQSIFLWIDAICLYSDRSRMKHCRNLRFEPPFCEGVDLQSGT